MTTRVCPSCGATDYGTPFCVSCQKPMERGGAATGDLELSPVARAGFIRRLAAITVDWLILGIIADILSFVYYFGSGVKPGPMEFDVTIVPATAVFILYFTFLTGDGGQTLGKKLLGIRVERVDGSKMGYTRAFLRTLGYFVSVFFMTFLGFLWALWDRKNQTWHDKIAGTEVVRS